MIVALDKANAKFKDDPRSLDYDLSDSDDQGPTPDEIEAACRDVFGIAIESGFESGP